MKIDLSELLAHGLIDEVTAQRIRQFYKNKSRDSGSSRFMLILSLIGIVLVGLGLILIVAYNWDQFSKWVKIGISFIPLLISQILGIYVLRKKSTESLWTESVALAILFSVGIAISLLSQIYHIEAEISGFIKWWILLAAALPFIFDSRSASLALWVGVGWYLSSISWDKDQAYDFFPLVMIIVLAVWYVLQWRKGLQNNLLIFHHWTIPVVLTLFLFFNSSLLCERFVVAACLVTFIGYGTLAFGPFSEQKFLSNGYRAAQFLGIWITGMVMTFDFFWTDLAAGKLLACLTSGNTWLPAVFLILLGFLVWFHFKQRTAPPAPDHMIWLGLGLVLALFTGEIHPATGQFLSNLFILAAAAKLIYDGVTGENLIVVNLGLLSLTVWILAWFFGHDFSFVWKGLLFIALGLLCFGINWMIIKKQKRV